jgi:hypothetical protein
LVDQIEPVDHDLDVTTGGKGLAEGFPVCFDVVGGKEQCAPGAEVAVAVM